MGKRVPPDEKPFNPVEAALIRSVLAEEPPREEALLINARSVGGASTHSGVAVPADVAPPPKATREDDAPAPALTHEKLSREKRVLLTPSEERELERIVNRVAAELLTPVKLSHLLRACITVLRHAESDIADQARRIGPLSRPSNGDPAALIEFERRLAQILSLAFRDAARIR